MKKTLVLLLLVTLVLSKQFDSYTLTNKASSSGQGVELNTQDLVDVLKHNFGSLISKPSEKALNFIKEAGKTAANIFNPVRANFLILINGNIDKKFKEIIVGNSTIKFTLNLENTGSNHLFDQIFNTESTQSLINSVYSFSEEQIKKEFYIFSQEKSFSNYFENFGVQVSVDENGFVKIEDKQVNKVHKTERFQKCVNMAISGKFRYDATQNVILNQSTQQKINIDSTNAEEIKYFLTELCGMKLVSSSFKKENASFLAIEVTSLPKLQKVLSHENYVIAQEILTESLKKVIDHYQQVHQNNYFGQVIFAEEEQDKTYLVSQESKKMKVRVLTEVNLTDEQHYQANLYTLRSWFGIFFVLSVAFILIAIFNVEITKDSLLYAKFIAEERR
ncbi:hypothetical protein ABPG72_010528 [Tetrahymena utriculariae]